jgi:hypothetical protein
MLARASSYPIGYGARTERYGRTRGARRASARDADGAITEQQTCAAAPRLDFGRVARPLTWAARAFVSASNSRHWIQ